MVNTSRAGSSARDTTSYWALSTAGRAYVAAVVAGGAWLVAWFAPSGIADPLAFAALTALSCLTSAWKVLLPLPLNSGCTLSVSYAANLMALMLIGPNEAMVVALIGAWTQCTFRVKRRYPPYRTAFSLAAEAITIQATGAVYAALGGFASALTLTTLPKALVGAIITYFVVNTSIFAVVIALFSRQRIWRVWNESFLWSAPSFMVAGAAGAVAAMVIQHGHHWLAMMMVAPVYLTYRTYHVFLGRIRDQQRHVEETRRLHAEAVEALLQARRAEQALAAETERLAVTLRSIGDGVITTDLNGTILLINNMAEQMTGWMHDEAVGRPISSVFCSFDPQTRQPCTSAVSTLTQDAERSRVARCTLLAARDLSERPIEEVSVPLRDAAGQHDRDGRGVPRHQRRTQGAGGTRARRQARVAWPARGRHRPRLQQHPVGHHGQRVDGPRLDAVDRRERARARRGGKGVYARAAVDMAVADVLEGRRADQEDGRPSDDPPGLREPGAAGHAGDVARSGSIRICGPSMPTRRSSPRCSATC